MKKRFSRSSLVQFSGWMLLLVVGSFFLFSFDSETFKELDGQGKYNVAQKIFKSIRLPRIRLGIDLQGGAHLTIGVDIEEAIRMRLALERKTIEQAFDKKDFKAESLKKEIKDKSILMEFENENIASSAYGIIKSEVGNFIKVSRSGSLVAVMLSREEEYRIRTEVVEQAINVLKRRLDSAGVQGLTIHQHGNRQIVVQLPGEVDVESKKALISQTAHLEFKMVEKEAPDQDILLDEYDGELPADKMIVPGRQDGIDRYYLVSAFADITGNRIVHARMDFDEYGKPGVSFGLDSVGGKEFGELTSRNVGGNLGIIIDNVVYSVARIKEPITHGRVTISGSFTGEQAKSLEIVLNSGSLQAPLVFESENHVGASLGQDSIRKGMISCLVGLALLLIFSIFYYKIPGIFAMIALFFNLFLVLLFLSAFSATLTLPGIAGMVLTIGMAIDASILIYEKIREELSDGATLRKAIKDGFSDAMVVIMDSNITTFLTGLVLFKFGGPAIRGFAVTLMLGIIATLLSGVFFLRSLFEVVLDATDIKKLKF